MTKGGSVYILTNVLHSVLYTGVTSNLVKRIQEHQTKKFPKSFTAKYNVIKLVYYRNYATIEDAISEEKRIKAGSRLQKCKLINSVNPTWNDLWESEVSMW